MWRTALVVVLAACSGGETETESVGETDRGPSTECSASTDRVEAAMQGDLDGTWLAMADPEFQLPERARGTVEVGSAPTLLIGVDNVILEGSVVDTPTLLSNLATIGRNWTLLHPDEDAWDKQVNVLADKRVTFERVDAALEPLLAAGYSFVLMAATPVEPAPPCPADWPACAQLGSPDPAEQARRMAEAMSSVLGQSCQSVVALFGRIATVPADQKPVELRAGLPSALRACNCEGIHMERLEWLAPELIGLRQPRAVGVEYEAGREGSVGDWFSAGN